MHRIVNVPHAKNKNAHLVTETKDDYVYVKVMNPNIEVSPNNSSEVCSLYIGEHLFEPHLHNDLRRMVGRALVFAIEQARDIGYRQAQADIREALGIRRE